MSRRNGSVKKGKWNNWEPHETNERTYLAFLRRRLVDKI